MAPRRKMEWLRFETAIRHVLDTAASYETNPHADACDLALLLCEISTIVGDETGRGYPLQERLGQEEAFLRRFGVNIE